MKFFLNKPARKAIALSLLLFLGNPGSTIPAGAPAGAAVLRAASLNPGGNGVALRWTLQQGWLPDGGFNVYRVENGSRTRLNKDPLGAKAKRGGSAAASRWQVAVKSAKTDKSQRLEVFQDNYKAALEKASQLPTGVTEESVRVFSATRHARPPSSKPVFEAIGDKVQQMRYAPGPALPAKVAQLQLRNLPAVSNYMKALTSASEMPKPAQKTSAPSKPQTGPIPPDAFVLSPIEELRTIRHNVLAGALIHSEMASDLGLSFDDKEAKADAKYEYALRSIDAAGKESAEDVATVIIPKVGADAPLLPTGLVARQLDGENVGLRWERLTPEQTDVVGLPSYQVFRLGPGGDQGLALSKSPLVLADIPVADGHLEPINFVQDRKVPVGDVSYQLVQTDMFGRQTKSEVLKFKMEDWQTPAAPKSAQAELKGNDVTFAWEASLLESGQVDPGVQYRIYREDIELKDNNRHQKKPDKKAGALDFAEMIRDSAEDSQDAKRELLTTTGIKGDNLDLPAARSAAATPLHRGRLAYALSRHPQGWLKYVDHNVPPDHKYRYLVTAAYPKNNMESIGTLTTPVLVPVKTAPPPPANVRISVKTGSPGTPRVTADSGGRFTIAGRNDRRPMKLPAYFKAIRQQDTGAEVTISWDPVAGTAPVSYRVYRASATGLFGNPASNAAPPGATNMVPGSTSSNSKVRPLSPSQPAAVNPVPVDKSGPSSAGPKKSNLPAPNNTTNVSAHLFSNVFQMPPAALRQLTIGKHVLRYMDDIGTPPDSSFALVGEIKGKTTFTDDIGRSQAHRYVYRVIAVNRWGVPAGGPREGIKGAEVKVRVPATMPPGAPAFLSVEQDDVGNIDLQFRPNLEEENVTSYEIRRRLIPSPAVKVSPATGASAKGIARFGIQPSGSAINAILRSNPALLTKPAVVSSNKDQDGYEVIGTKNPKGAVDGILTFRDPKVTAHQVYSYYIVAINQDNLRTSSGDLLCSAEISPEYKGPAKLTPTATCESVKLIWPVTAEAKNYIVERALKTAPANRVQLSGIGRETTYVDHSVQPGESYSYRVIGVTEDGNVTEPVQTDVTVPVK
ncbi:MAG: hypothetical protein QOH88_3481 [Verrucomicrobiota bacterium]|jgi:fibronectin type 3 domain-containing protein